MHKYSSKPFRDYAREVGLLTFSHEMYYDVHRDKKLLVHYRTRRYFRLKINFEEYPTIARVEMQSLKFFVECNYPGCKVRIYRPHWQIGHSERRGYIALSVKFPDEEIPHEA